MLRQVKNEYRTKLIKRNLLTLTAMMGPRICPLARYIDVRILRDRYRKVLGAVLVSCRRIALRRFLHWIIITIDSRHTKRTQNAR